VVAANDGIRTLCRNKTFKNDEPTSWKLVFGHGAVVFARNLTIIRLQRVSYPPVVIHIRRNP